MKLREEAKRKMAVGTRSNEQRAAAIMQEVVRAQHGQICFLLLHFDFFCWGFNNRWTGAAAEEEKNVDAHNQISYPAKLRIKPPALAGGGLVLAETLESFAVMAWYTL